MLYLLKRLVRTVGRTPSQAIRDLLQKIDPAEREFQRVWPFIDRIDGFLISPAQERWLFEAARSLPDKSIIVEIGSFKGRSTCCLAYGCRGTSKHVFAIDTFEGNDKDFRCGDPQYFTDNFLTIFQSNIERNGLTNYVTPMRGVSSQLGKSWKKPISLLFIDGGHEYEDVLADFEAFYPHVISGGIVAFHDVHNSPEGPVGFPGILRVWRERAMPLLSDHGACHTLAFGKTLTT